MNTIIDDAILEVIKLNSGILKTMNIEGMSEYLKIELLKIGMIKIQDIKSPSETAKMAAMKQN